MADLTSTSVIKEKTVAKGSTVANAVGNVYTRIIECKFPAGAASGSTVVIGSLPKGTVILGAYVYTDLANTNSATIKLTATTSTAIFSAAIAPVAGAWTTTTVTTPLANPSLLVDDTITATTAVGAMNAAATVVQWALVCASIDVETGRSAAVGN